MSVTETQKLAVETEKATGSINEYQRFCDALAMDPVHHAMTLDKFATTEELANRSLSERMTAAMQVLIEMVGESEHNVDRLDKNLIDLFITRVDAALSSQLDEILHHPQFQQLESSWNSLKYLVDNVDFRANSKLELLDVSKESLRDDFEDAPETIQSGLYKHIYVQEYDTPGGEPFSSVVSNYEFDSGAPDIALLGEIARVASSAHCPFIGSVGASFFKKRTIDEVTRIEDLANYMERADFIRWNGFRDSEDSRYIGLTLPRFLLRLPYGQDNPVRAFDYQENVQQATAERYLWGNASFAFAANMARSFKKYGWTVNIRGPESGGKIDALPLHQYDVGKGLQTKIPTETIISETRELEYANLGFIPLSYYKNSDFACFFSANSAQKPQLYSTAEATANARINGRLPYIFLSSRLGHYLKVLQRENIGSSKNKSELESELNEWLQTLVTKMNKPGPELAATHPLRDGQVIVDEIADNPGFYKVSMYAVPHFQIEGVDVKLSLVGQMPKTIAKK